VVSRNLRPADELLRPAVEQMVAALDAPPADAPLIALARQLAAAIDDMPPAVRDAMLPQHAGPLLKVLDALEARAVKRRPDVPARPSRLDELRMARTRQERPR
jgi:hypothetical protein